MFEKSLSWMVYQGKLLVGNVSNLVLDLETIAGSFIMICT
jgi:hypothetical protein